MTLEIFRNDHYARTCDATILEVCDEGLYLDQTVFYPVGGGQPGDRGQLTFGDGTVVDVVDATKAADGRILHKTTSQSRELIGAKVHCSIDWDRRYRLMRVHTLLHLLCAVIPEAVTGGSIRDDGTGRLDFDIPSPTLDKEAITDSLNRLVLENHPVTVRWVDDTELDNNPELVRTMSVAPPKGQGRVRLLEIDGVDLQACGGTHVSATGEIGPVRVRKIEKKGKQNRRVNLELVQER